MAITYEPIATTTLADATTNTVTFSGISGTYTDLVAIINTGGTTSTLSSLQMRFNSDTGSNYSTTTLYGTGSSAASGRYTSQTKMLIGNIVTALPLDVKSNCVVQIQNYSNATTYKTALARFNDSANDVNATVSLWRDTDAITTVTFFTPLSYFANTSTFTLYGIASA
jgi:hypothetical protein